MPHPSRPHRSDYATSRTGRTWGLVALYAAMAVWVFAPGLAFVALLTAALALVVAGMVALARWLQAWRERRDRPE